MSIRSITVLALLTALLVSISHNAYAKSGATMERTEAPISQEIVDLLKAGELKEAILAMREVPSNPKINYLIRCANQIVFFNMQKNPSQSTAHETFQNVAIAYHNLFLFLKSTGIVQEQFFKQANRYYKKAKSAGTYLHKSECDVLNAALLASWGDVEKAKKNFSKVDALMLRGDYESTEYLAAYYAAVGDLDNALDALEAAYKLNPHMTLAWTGVGDDFHDIESDPRYIAMISAWKNKKNKAEPTLSVPKSDDPSLVMTKNIDPNEPYGIVKHTKKQYKPHKKRKK